jgi:hypothetical protein
MADNLAQRPAGLVFTPAQLHARSVGYEVLNHVEITLQYLVHGHLPSILLFKADGHNHDALSVAARAKSSKSNSLLNSVTFP